MNKSIGIVCGVLGFAVAGFAGKAAVQKLFFPDIESQIVKMAAEVNRTLPIMVDTETRLDNIQPGPGKSFTYNYTIFNAAQADIDVDQLRAVLEPTVKSKAAAAKEMKVFFKNGVTVNYSYHDSDGRAVVQFSVTPRDAGY